MKNRREVKQEEIRKQQLMDDLERMQQELQWAYNNLSYVVEPDLIDSYIFQVNAIQKKYKFVLNLVKEQWASADN